MIWTNLIPWSISALCLLFTIITFARNGRKERKQEYQEEDAKIDGIKESLLKANMKLDTVCATTNETRTDIKAMDKTMQEFDKRVTGIEKDMKTMWIRIDELKGKVEHYHEGA